MAKTKPTTVRLTKHGKGLLAAIAEEMGVSQSDVIEVSIREKAKRMKIVFTDSTAGDTGIE